MPQATSPFLGFKGIAGPIYRLDPATNTPLLDDDGLPIVLDSSGFYRVELKNFDEIKKRAVVSITPYQSKRKFIRNPDASVYGGFVITYYVNNKDQVVDESSEIITPGTFDTFFGKSVIRANNTCESDQARNFVLSLNGTNPVQVTFPINFSTMTVDNITQNNINNALA
jgi:hypothetical protein